MGHTVESRPRGAGRLPGTRPSHGYRCATRVHVQARLRMQDAPALRSPRPPSRPRAAASSWSEGSYIRITSELTTPHTGYPHDAQLV
jgi:hypothetical protein